MVDDDEKDFFPGVCDVCGEYVRNLLCSDCADKFCAERIRKVIDYYRERNKEVLL